MTAAVHSLDIALRSGAGLLLLLIGGLMLRDHGRATGARLGAAFAVGGAIFAITSSAGFHRPPQGWDIPLMALATGNNVVFWLFARALFDDGFRLKPRHAALWATMVGLPVLCALVLHPARWPTQNGIDDFLTLAALGFAVLATAQTIGSYRGDLVEPRRRVRVLIVAASAGFIVLTAVSNLMGAQEASPALASLVGAAGLAAIALGVAWALLGVAGGRALFPEAAPARPAAELEPVDPRLIAALERAMLTDRAYRKEALTIGALAHRLGAPEHRLRKAINQGLGFRNFNAYLNSFRIAETLAALADPAQAEVPILTIALDAGFNSLGPFNRAFRAATGTTPTAYRRQALGAGDAPPISGSAGRIPNSA